MKSKDFHTQNVGRSNLGLEGLLQLSHLHLRVICRHLDSLGWTFSEKRYSSKVGTSPLRWELLFSCQTAVAGGHFLDSGQMRASEHAQVGGSVELVFCRLSSGWGRARSALDCGNVLIWKNQWLAKLICHYKSCQHKHQVTHDIKVDLDIYGKPEVSVFWQRSLARLRAASSLALALAAAQLPRGEDPCSTIGRLILRGHELASSCQAAIER